MTTVLQIRKRPETSTCVIYDGTNAREIVAWSGKAYEAEGQLYVMTDRGDVPADPGDAITKGLVGEVYPQRPEALEAGWEIVGSYEVTVP